MKIPKNIEKLLDKRQKLAEDLICANADLDDWLEKNGADLTDADICDAVLTGCMIYCEPSNAKRIVIDYIENKM